MLCFALVWATAYLGRMLADLISSRVDYTTYKDVGKMLFRIEGTTVFFKVYVASKDDGSTFNLSLDLEFDLSIYKTLFALSLLTLRETSCDFLL